MRGFIEKFPDLVQSNPGGKNDPLGESILDRSNEWLRIFEPQELAVVIGRNQDPNRECKIDNVQADSIPVYRRVSGGGTVVLGPGSVVVALRLKQVQRSIDDNFALINKAQVAALQECAVNNASCFGHGDLALREGDGSIKKILGASLRQTKDAVYYLGVFLVADLIPLMDRYLAMPSKQPDYRGDRVHADFCTNLANKGVMVSVLIPALEAHLRDQLTTYALLD